jgi:hypothetical protein
MAAFSTFSAAETRAYAKVADKTWINAHAARNKTGTIIVRIQRKMSATNPDYGAWVEIDQDNQT